MTRAQREDRIAEIERKHTRGFLVMSLHADACEWRGLTAHNASWFDEPTPREAAGGEVMTPQEYEWTIEKLEDAYKRGDFGKITFHRRASQLGFKTDGIRAWLRELDADRRVPSQDKIPDRSARPMSGKNPA